MKKIILLASLCILYTASANSQWRFLGPYVGQVSALVAGNDRIFTSEIYGGIYSTVDSGETWDYKYHLGTQSYRPVLDWDETNNRLYTGNFDKIFYSEDKGLSWTQAYDFGLNYQIVGIAAVGDTLLVSTFSNGTFLSLDAGQVWTPVNNGLPGQNGGPVMIIGQWMFLDYGGGWGFRSTIANPFWTALNILPPSYQSNSIVFYGGKLYASCFHGIRVSIDTGTTWLNDTIFRGRDVVDIATDGKRIIGRENNNYTLFISSDSGQTYVQIQGFGTYEFLYSGQYLFAATDSGIYRSSDDGMTWTYMNNFIAGSSIADAAFVGNDLMLASNYGCFLSSDSGSTWLSRSNWPNTNYFPFLIKSFNDTLLLSMRSSDLMISTDHGTSWIQKSVPMHELLSIIIRPGKWLGANRNGVYYSNNFGSSWSPRMTGIPGSQIYINQLLESGNTVYCIRRYPIAIYRSYNYGLNWTAIPTSGLDTMSIGINLVNLGSKLFFSTTLGGIYIADTSNFQWQTSGVGLDTLEFVSLATHKGLLFASVREGGILQSVDSGMSWRRYGLENFTSSFHSAGNRFYALNAAGAFVLDSSVTSIEETIKYADWRVFPTLNDGVFTISLPDSKGINSIILFSIDGREALNVPASGQSSQQVNARLASGEYLIRVVSGKEFVYRKIIIGKR